MTEKQHPVLLDIKIEGKGSFAPPPNITQEEADRLAREADEQRKKE